MKSSINKILSIVLIMSPLVVFINCDNQSSSVSRPLLGTIVTVTISDKNEDKADDFSAAFKEIEIIQKEFNPNDPESEISRINKKAYIKPVGVRADVFFLIKKSLEISEITDGAFDITFASIGKLWDFSNDNFALPDDAIIKKKLPFISYKNISLNKGTQTIQLLKKDTKIALGGIAKGYAVSKAITALKDRGVRAAIIACAGDIQVIGTNNGSPWRAGIKDPRGESIVGVIDMYDGEAVSTSGDYERFRFVNGKRYHHIIDPRTGYPAESKLISVSVFSSDPVLSDAYSTAFFVSGLEKSKLVLSGLEGVSAVLVTDEMKIYVSNSLKHRIRFREGLTITYF